MRIIDFVDAGAITTDFAQNPLLPNLFYAITDLEGKTLAEKTGSRYFPKSEKM